MDKSKINTPSAIILTLSIVVSYINSSLPRTFINETKSATLLNIVYTTAIVLCIILLFCNLFEKFPGLDILDIANYLGRQVFKTNCRMAFYNIFHFHIFNYFKKLLSRACCYLLPTNKIYFYYFDVYNSNCFDKQIKF